MNDPAKIARYRAMKRLYKNYVRSCRNRNIFWEIPQEEFAKLTSQQCTYCGKEPAQQWKKYTYNGIDRINPKQGYTRDNAVTACGECNGIKSNRLTYDEMKVVGEALAIYRRKKKSG